MGDDALVHRLNVNWNVLRNGLFSLRKNLAKRPQVASVAGFL
jgi:hypothetical protein